MKRLILCALLLAAGCAHHEPFTHQVRQGSRLDAEGIARLQFFLQGRIHLRRELTESERKVDPSHRLIVIDGKRIEEIEVLDGTPGVVRKVEPDAVCVQFELGHNCLWFAAFDDTPAVQADDKQAEKRVEVSGKRVVVADRLLAMGGELQGRYVDKYKLAGADWQKKAGEWRGRVQYGEGVYQADGDSARAYLAIDRDKKQWMEQDQRRMPGVVLPTK